MTLCAVEHHPTVTTPGLVLVSRDPKRSLRERNGAAYFKDIVKGFVLSSDCEAGCGELEGTEGRERCVATSS